MREIFVPAANDYTRSMINREKPNQHLVIIDEIDSMFGTRGLDKSTSAGDKATATFIS